MRNFWGTIPGSFPTLGVTLGLGKAVGTSLLGGSLSAISRAGYYASNRTFLNLKPDIDSALQVYNSGAITHADLTDVLANHGISWEVDSVGGSVSTKVFRELVRLSKPQLPLELQRDNYRRGLIGPDRMMEVMRKYGYSSLADWNDFVAKKEELDILMLLRMYYAKAITKEGFAVALRKHGYRDSDIEGFVESQYEALPVAETLEMFNRGLLSQENVRSNLFKSGIVDPRTQNAILETAKIIPPYSDIQRLAVREAWDDEIAREYGYDEEIPPEFIYWCRKTGIHWEEAIPGDDPALIEAGEFGGVDRPGHSWSKLLWRAKWQPLSPTQAFEALHRFRGDKDNPATWKVNPATGERQKPFTIDDVNRMLKIADYPTALRPVLAGLSYGVLRLVDIRKIYKIGLRGSDWAVERFQDRGVTKNDAILTVDMMDLEEERKKEAEIKKRVQRSELEVLKQTVEGYKLGWRTTEDVRQVYSEIGYTDREAGLAINAVNLELANETASLAARRAQSDYLNGRADEIQIRERLQRAGLRPDYVDQLFVRWNTMRTESRSALAATKVLSLAKRGFVDVNAARERLRLLGYGPLDTELLIAEADQDFRTLQRKEAEAELRKRNAIAGQLERVQKSAVALNEKIMGRLRTLTPITSLKKWLRNGQITPEQFFDRMASMGWPREVAQLHFDEVSAAIAKDKGEANGE